jgi:hypothetical protein
MYTTTHISNRETIEFCLLLLNVLVSLSFVYLQLLGQSATAPTTTSASAQSPLSETNPPPSLSPNGGTQPGPLSPGALSQTSQNAGTTNTPNGAPTNSGSTCCENGRPIMNDPVSGQTICSCQYDSARLALSSYSRLPSAGVYGTPYPSTDQNPYPSIGVDSSAFYSPLVSTRYHHYYGYYFESHLMAAMVEIKF